MSFQTTGTFVVKDSNIFRMPGNPHMLHLGTIGSGLREFVVMTCIAGRHEGKTYIEEVVLTSVDWQKDVFANLRFIVEDTLAQDLAEFAREKGLLNIKERSTEFLSAISC